MAGIDLGSGDNRFMVAVRVRPPIERERLDLSVVRKIDEHTIGVLNEENDTTSAFTFDRVFDTDDDQSCVYEEAVTEMVDHALDGNNVTILTYGQTGSGKTFTILGEISTTGEMVPNSGVFLRVLNSLLEYKALHHLEFLMTLSAVELYVDDVLDLLNNKNKVRAREIGEETLLPGVLSFSVDSMDDAVAYFARANSFRATAATEMNDTSSRSHAVFFIDLFSKEDGAADPNEPFTYSDLLYEDENGNMVPRANIRRSRISLVDLAGSEKIHKSGVEGQAKKEATATNKSLSALSTVMHQLYSQNKHVSFRDSKLTRLLRSSLMDATSRFLLIGQLAPSYASRAESISTCRFCNCVKTLKVSTTDIFDKDEELRFLERLRDFQEQASNVRIAMVEHYYSPIGATRMAKRKGVTVSELIEELGATLLQQSRWRKEEAEMVDAVRIQQEVMGEATQLIMEKQQRVQEVLAELTSIETSLLSMGTMAALEEEHEARLNKETNRAKKAKKTRLEVKDKRDELKKKIERLGDVTSPRSKANPASSSTAAAAAAPSALDDDDEEEWNEFENDWAICEANHMIVDLFHTNWEPLTKLQKKLVKASVENNKLLRDSEKKRLKSSDSLGPGSIVLDVIDFTIDRACDIAEGRLDPTDSYAWIDVIGCSSRLKEPHAWPLRPLQILERSHMPVTGIEYPPTTVVSSDEDESAQGAGLSRQSRNTSGTGSSMVAGGGQGSAAVASSGKGSHPNAGAVAAGGHGITIARSATSSAPSSPPNASAPPSDRQQAVQDAKEKRKKVKNTLTKKYDAQEADKHYLMTVYDSPSLLQDVLRYLGNGSELTKHGRAGKPHKRKFWIASTGPYKELVWVDPETYPSSKRSSISISDISAVTLGPFSKVFKRYPSNPGDKEYYLSFTVHVRDNSRTLDMVADTLVDFEAWVLGISNLARVDPAWGGQIDISKDSAQSTLSAKQQRLCALNHITPTSFSAIRQKVVAVRDEVSMHMRLFGNNVVEAYQSMGGIHLPQMNSEGAVLMTKGELRFWSSSYNLDIFRVCRLWEDFAENNLIYDPGYAHPTGFGITHRT